MAPRCPALLEPLPCYLLMLTFRSLRTAPKAQLLGCDPHQGTQLRPLPRQPGQARTLIPADSPPDSRKEGSEGEAGAPRGGRVLIRSDLLALRSPTATVTKMPARDPLSPQNSPDPGPRLTCLLRWLPPSQRRLGLQLRPRRSWAHPAGDFETSAAPAPPRRWGKPRPRGGNQRK